MPVSIEGILLTLVLQLALTEKSLRWESEGVSFFIASETLTMDEMIEVASSMSMGEDEINIS